MTDEVSLEAVQSAIKKRNEQVALKLSLLPNSPNERGENRIDEEAYRLERTRVSWEDIESPIVVGDEVLIPTGTPVGIVPMGAYIVGEEPIWGTLARTHSLRGGSGYMEQGHRTRNALSLVTRPHIKGQAPIAVDLLVPNDMYQAVLQESTNIPSNTPIA